MAFGQISFMRGAGKIGKPVQIRREPVAVTGDSFNEIPLTTALRTDSLG
jgi:hypothetical protein